jgi:hypothetical protein
VFFGDAGLGITRHEYEQRIATCERWNELSKRAQGAELPRETVT